MFDTKCTHTFTFPLYVTDRNVAMLHFGSICKPVTVQLYVFVFVVSGPPIFVSVTFLSVVVFVVFLFVYNTTRHATQRRHAIYSENHYV